MRHVNLALAALMLLFAAVQHNDPDGPLWAAIYLGAAFWAALAARRPAALGRPPAVAFLVGCLACAGVGVVHYWPRTPRWWTKAVWWEVETAREGMGMMIVALVLVVALLGARLGRAPRGR